jgi:hypothetical protein
MKSATLRKWLLFFCFFVGIGAVGGAAGMMADPTGKLMKMDALPPTSRCLPFAGALFPEPVLSRSCAVAGQRADQPHGAGLKCPSAT